MPSPLYLIGFMAAGKTTVGRALAGASGRRFVDLDDVIGASLLADSGESVAQLVARDEPALRGREATALADVIATADDGPVVATGGGAAAHGDNLDRMRADGLVVALGVDVADAVARAAGGPARPLLTDLGAAAQLAARRAPAYRRATAVVDTTGRSVDAVVASVQAVERAWLGVPSAHRPNTTVLELGARSYPIVVIDDAAHPIDGALVRTHLPGVTRVAVITDRTVAGHWLASATAALRAAGLAVDTLEIEAGEASKSAAVYHQVCEQLIARGLDRGSAIVALGGGVVGDLAGFVAATLFRGVPVVQLPTTLVAMTDAAIGGKTAIDLAAGKNLVGAFWQPTLVACGLATLATLPIRERRAGFGELWKYALLDGPGLWAAVDHCAPWAASSKLGDAAPPELRAAIARCIAYKAAVVSRDEREQTGQRARLNLGHTIGHAIESAAAGALHHGEAVGLGLIAACRVSAALGVARTDLAIEVTDALDRTGLPADLDIWLTDDVLARVAVDKKRTGGTLKFITVREVGECEPVEIALTEVTRILRRVPAP